MPNSCFVTSRCRNLICLFPIWKLLVSSCKCQTVYQTPSSCCACCHVISLHFTHVHVSEWPIGLFLCDSETLLSCRVFPVCSLHKYTDWEVPDLNVWLSVRSHNCQINCSPTGAAGGHHHCIFDCILVFTGINVPIKCCKVGFWGHHCDCKLWFDLCRQFSNGGRGGPNGGVIPVSALRRSEVLSGEQFCRPVCCSSEAMPDRGEETDTSDRLPLCQLKGLDALWLRFLIPASPPNLPAQINPLSLAHKGNGHGRVWFISHWAIIRAQSATHLPPISHTHTPPGPPWPLLPPHPPVPPSHRLSHTQPVTLEEDTGTKTSAYQKKLISN